MKKINEVSQLAGVSKRTLQYYDDQEVFVVKRTDNNHRLYDEQALQNVWQTMIYKEMGFDLKQIKTMLSVSDEERYDIYNDQKKKLQEEICGIKVKEELIAYVLNEGIPELPDENGGRTYAECLEELQKRLSTREDKGDE